MGNNKPIRVLMFAVLTAVAAAALYFALPDGGGRRRNVDLYFLNEQHTSIIAESREIKYKTSDDLPYEVVCALIKGPSDGKKSRVLPEGTQINSIEVIKGDVVVDFSDEYLSGDSAQDILSAYAVVKSLCGIPNINRVKVSVCKNAVTTPSGSRLGFLSNDDIKLESDMNKDETRKVKLYFADSAANGLACEEREINCSDDQPLEQLIVSELIKGPSYTNLAAVLTADTQVISVQTKDGICFVNLKANFLDRNSGSGAKESFAVYSIVNSLTEIDAVNAVQFLIEGKKVNEFGQFGFGEPFVRNDEMIIGESK